MAIFPLVRRCHSGNGMVSRETLYPGVWAVYSSKIPSDLEVLEGREVPEGRELQERSLQNHLDSKAAERSPKALVAPGRSPGSHPS